MAFDINNSDICSVSTAIHIEHTYHIVSNTFDPKTPDLASLYSTWQRCLAVVDYSVYTLYGDQIKTYFEMHKILATIQPIKITEDRKDVETLLQICGWITDFNILRREPVLAIGGGLLTDVVG